MTKNFGQHLMVDGYNCDTKALCDAELMRRTMAEIALAEKMHMLIEPVVVEAQGNGKGDHGGYSGFVIIQESHISIHTFPVVGFVSIDVYTCNSEMDIGQMLNTLRIAYSIKNMEVHVQDRGTMYPVV